MDSDESSKPSLTSSNKEFSLKDAHLIIGLQPIKVNNNAEEEEEFCLTEKNFKLTKSSHIQTVLTSNNKLRVKVKTDNKSIDVLMKKAYDLRKNNMNFNIMLRKERDRKLRKETELQNESINLEKVDDENKFFKFSLSKKHTERAKSLEKSEQLGQSCNELLQKLKDMPNTMANYEQEIENLKVKLQSIKDKCMREVHQEELERERLKQKYKNLDKICEQQKNKIAELKMKKENIMKEREQQQEEFLENEKISKAKQNELDKNFNSLQKILFEKEMTNKAIEKKNMQHDRTRSEIQKIKSNIDSLQDTNNSLREKLKELKLQVSKINFEMKANSLYSPKRLKKI